MRASERLRRIVAATATLATVALCTTIGWAEEPATAPAKPSARGSLPQTCSLVRVASVDLRTKPDGRVSLPVKVNDRPIFLIVDTGGIYSSLRASFADSLGLARKAFPYGARFVFYGRAEEKQHVRADTLTIGGLTGKDPDFPLMPDFLLETDETGLLAPNVMVNYDVEIDFLNEKFSLFTPEHCDGNVVYWTKGVYAQVPIDLDREWHISVPVVLDGKRLKATIDTGASSSVMTLEHARDLFGWKDNDPALKTRPGGLSRYSFAAMTFEGIAIHNPDIQLVPKSEVARGAPELLLGVNVLRQLHLYIAYKDKVLYLTPAEAQ